MSVYLQPILSALFFFPILAFVLTLPILIYHYRKQGMLPFVQALILYSFILYLICAYFLIILPLPNPEWVATLKTPTLNLHLFSFISTFVNETNFNPLQLDTYITTLKSPAFIEPFFNIVLTIPFGIYLRYYFKHSLKATILYSFLLSCFFELSQLTGLFFIYPRPYRLADVNDLLLNTLGGFIGFIVAPYITFLLPKMSDFKNYALNKEKRISIIRRLVALIIDLFIVSLLNTVFKHNLPFLNMLAYFSVSLFITNGYTIGKYCVSLRVFAQNRYAYLIRAILLYGFIFNIPSFFESLVQLLITENVNTTYILFIVSFFSIILLIFTFYLLLCIIKKRPFFYENISKSYVVSTITIKKE